MKSDKKIAIMATAIMVISVFAFALVMPASAAEKYLWEQVSEEGFGDLTNDYAWSMASYTVNETEYLYVGTLNTNFSAELDDPPLNWSNVTDGCEIWRTNGSMYGSKYDWEQVVGPTGTQFIIPPIGIISPATAGFGTYCIGTRGMIVYKELLWVGTNNPAAGAQVWVTNGTHWKLANVPGFGNQTNMSTRGMAVFNDKLYVGADNAQNGARVMKYNGSTNFTDIGNVSDIDKWDAVSTPGFGEPETNLGVGELVTFNASEEYLYAGTWNGTGPQLIGAIFNDWNFSSLVGCQVWRTNGTVNASDPPRLIWEQVEDNGFGNPPNGGILSSAVFNGSLYMGTQNFVNGSQIWRTSDGINWTAVTTMGFKDIAGFKAFGNGYMWCMFNYSDMLFVGTMNPILGCQVWKSSTGDPGTFEQVNVNGMNNERKIPIADLGCFPIAGIDQYGVRSFAEFNGNLHLGTASFGDWIDKIIEQGSGDSSNYSEYVGCEVWRTNCTTYIPPTINVTKTVWNGTAWVTYLEAHVGNVVRFNVTIASNDTINVTNVTITDFLSGSLDYADDATLTLPDGGTQKREPDCTFTLPLFNLTILKWKLSDLTIEPGQTMYLEYDAYVVKPGLDVNFLYALGYSETGDYDCSWGLVLICSQPAPSGDATDPIGNVQEVYSTGEPVYSRGSGFANNSSVTIYIVRDMKWIGGENVSKYNIFAGPVVVPTDAVGNIVPTEIWPNPIPGEYDMFFDADPANGIYDLLTDVVDNPHDPGFIVFGKVPALTPIGIAALVGLLAIIATSTIVRKKKER